MSEEESLNVDPQVLIGLWSTICSVAQSLAELGRWDGVLADEGGLDPGVYRDFLVEFDVTRKLLESRRALDGLLVPLVGEDRLESLAAELPEWRYSPG